MGRQNVIRLVFNSLVDVNAVSMHPFHHNERVHFTALIASPTLIVAKPTLYDPYFRNSVRADHTWGIAPPRLW
jgi:hypothetical protein